MNLNSITHVINNLSNTMNGVIMRLNDIEIRMRDLQNQGSSSTPASIPAAPGPDMKKYVDDQIAVVKQQMQRLDEGMQQTNRQIGTMVSNAAAGLQTPATATTTPAPTLTPTPTEPLAADMGSSSLAGAAASVDVLGDLNAAAGDDAGDFTIETTKKKVGRKSKK